MNRTQEEEARVSWTRGVAHRHNAALRAVYTAIAAGSPSSLTLGDKGDGTRAGQDAARRRYAYWCKDHVPDIIDQHLRVLYELKVCTPYHATLELGTGNRDGGGSVSTADGHRIAFGGTEERQRVDNLGLRERGGQGDGPWRRSGDASGTGWVQARDVVLTQTRSASTSSSSCSSASPLAPSTARA